MTSGLFYRTSGGYPYWIVNYSGLYPCSVRDQACRLDLPLWLVYVSKRSDMNVSLDTGKLVCRGCWDLLLGLLDWLIGLLVGTHL